MAGPTLNIKLRCSSWQQFATIYKRDLSRGTMFLKATNQPPLGTIVRIDLELPSATIIELCGAVADHVADAQRGTGVELKLEPLPTQTIWLIENALAAGTQARANVRPEVEPVAAPAVTEGEDIVQAETELIRALEAEAESLKKLNPFLVLGVGYDTNDADVRAAFGELTKRYHPDRFARYQSTRLRQLAAEIFIFIRDAYRKLAEETTRAQTYSALGLGSPPARLQTPPRPPGGPPRPPGGPPRPPQSAAAPPSPPPAAGPAPVVQPSSQSAQMRSVAAPASTTPPAAMQPRQPAQPQAVATPPVATAPAQPTAPPSAPVQSAAAPPAPAQPVRSEAKPAGSSSSRDLSQPVKAAPAPASDATAEARRAPPAVADGGDGTLDALIDGGKFDDALAGYRALAKKNPQDRSARAGVELVEGYKALHGRDRLEAAQRFEAALEIDPSNERAARELADMRRQATNERKGLLSRLMGKKEGAS